MTDKKESCGHFHQHYIWAFEPFSLPHKKFNLFFKHKKALGENFVQKSRAQNVGEIDP